MKIVGFERLSLVDFDNYTSCTLFTEGCNFRCPFCHNAPLVEGVGQNGEIAEEDIFNYLSARKKLIDGVVISGGEPTLYSDLPDYIEKIKRLGYLVKLDTNGTNPEMLDYLISENLIDYVAMDIKNSLTNYAKTAGVEDAKLDDVNKSIQILKENAIPYEFRTTIVNELHDYGDMEEIAEMVLGCPKYFLQKFTSNENCISKGYSEVPLKKALEFESLLKKRGVNAILRGYDV